MITPCGFSRELPSLKKMSNHPFKLLNDRLDEIRSWIESSATKFNKTPSDFLWKMMKSLYNVIPVSISIPLTSEEKKAPSCSIPKTYHDKGLETYSENLSFQASQGDVLFWSPPLCPYPLASNSANLSFFSHSVFHCTKISGQGASGRTHGFRPIPGMPGIGAIPGIPGIMPRPRSPSAVAMDATMVACLGFRVSAVKQRILQSS